MELHELIRQRRTIHDYAEGPIPVGALERALEAAVSAPNHHLTEPWRFTQAGPQTRAALLAIGVDQVTRGGARPLSVSGSQRLKSAVLNPAELLIVSQVLSSESVVREEDYAAVACAIQNLTLSLWAEGIGSKWDTGAVLRDPRTYAQLAIDARHERIVGFLWVGYPEREQPPKATRRKNLAQLVRVLP